MESIHYQRWISLVSQELEARKLKNRNYSLRAYARDLGVSASTVSRLVNTEKISLDKIVKITTSLKIADDILVQVVKEIYH